MRFLRSGLYARFILVLGGLAILPSLCMGLLLMRISLRGMQASVLELHTKLAESLADKVSADLRTLDDKLRFTLDAVQKSNMGWPDKQDLLRSLIDTHPDIEEISVVKSNGIELLKVYNPGLSAKPALVSRAQDPGFQEFLRRRERTMWITPRQGQAPVLDLYYPLNTVICLRVSAVLGSLWDSVSAERVGGSGFAVVVGSSGEPLLYPPDRIDAATLAAFHRRAVVSQALTASSIGSTEFVDESGRSEVSAYAPIADLRGAVVTQQPKREAYWAALHMLHVAGWSFLVFGLIAIGVAAWMARQLAGPLLVLTRAAARVAEGTFPEPVHLETRDELQDLADTFNLMVGKLKRYAEIQVDRLVREQTKTEAILFSIGEGILMLDHERRIQLANRRAKELLGLPEGVALEGRELAEVLPASPTRDALLQVVGAPKEDVFKELDLSSDRYRRFLRFSAVPVVVPGKGDALGVVAAIRDVTMEKQLDKMKEEFLHSITHDLRNPVGSAIGFADFLLKGVVGVLNPQQQSMVESIRKASTRLLAMVNNILDLAKLEAGRMEVNLKETSLAGVAGHAIDILGSLAQRRGIKLELVAEEEYSLMADPDLMERVFANLIGNAIKFAREDGRVAVSFRDEPDAIAFCVADDGEGIPPQHLGRIFEKFEQVPGQRKGGTGLGLTICRHIVDAHLGKIWVESEVDKGARFYVRIPKDLAPGGEGKVVRRGTAAAVAEGA